MQKERTTLNVAALANNTGQLGWLPSNPRQWTQTDIDRTAKSLTNDPDFLEDRPLLALRDGKGFIIFAGNLRLTAARKLKLKEVPGIIYTPESDEDRETIKRRSILDNGSFGAWDYDILANEYDDLPLEDYGIPAWETSSDAPGVEENTAQEDNFVEENEEIHVICKKGDIWQLGDHRLMCGDSIELEEVEKLIGGGR